MHIFRQPTIILNYFKLVLVLIFINNYCLSQTKSHNKISKINKENDIGNNKEKNSYYKKEILKNKDNTFGYKILKDGKPIIIQESIPAVPGNKGFFRKIEAERMADLVIFKMYAGIMPPTVSKKEVDSVKTIK